MTAARRDPPRSKVLIVRTAVKMALAHSRREGAGTSAARIQTPAATEATISASTSSPPLMGDPFSRDKDKEGCPGARWPPGTFWASRSRTQEVQIGAAEPCGRTGADS
jgi:hypothetical protein